MIVFECTSVRDLYLDAQAGGWTCSALSSGDLIVSGPLTYSDGDLPEVLVTPGEGGVVVLSDFGSTAARLDLHAVQIGSPGAQQHVQRIVRGYGVDLTHDQQLHVEGSEADVGAMLLRLHGAMLQLDALVALRVVTPPPRFTSKLLRWLDSAFDGAIRPAAQVRGSSGKLYTVTAEVTPTGGEPILLQAVTKTKADNRAVDHAFRIFSEVNGAVDIPRKLSVLGADPSQFDGPDLELLSTVSYVATWAQPERLQEHLADPTAIDNRRVYADSAPPLA